MLFNFWFQMSCNGWCLASSDFFHSTKQQYPFGAKNMVSGKPLGTPGPATNWIIIQPRFLKHSCSFLLKYRSNILFLYSPHNRQPGCKGLKERIDYPKLPVMRAIRLHLVLEWNFREVYIFAVVNHLFNGSLSFFFRLKA